MNDAPQHPETNGMTAAEMPAAEMPAEEIPTAKPSAAKIPNIVIIGRPNVGKSLLFNRLLRRRRAIVHRAPGMTLDFIKERLPLDDDKTAWLIDTGGVAGEEDDWSALARRQTERAADIADGFIFVTDALCGRQPGDAELAEWLRRRWNAPWLLVVNKAENMPMASACADFYQLGAPRILAVSAKTNDGIDDLRDALGEWLSPAAAAAAEQSVPKITIVGRPNVGKSTFINRLLGDERMAVSPRPGTTRDAVSAELAHPEGGLLLFDTAGMKRKRAEAEREKISIASTRALLARADAAILLFDLFAGVTHQDKRIAALIESAGCGVVIIGNKADLLPAPLRATRMRDALAALSPCGALAAGFALSALSPRKMPSSRLLAAARAAAGAAQTRIPTARLNQVLSKILHLREPRRNGAIRPKLRYAHQGGIRPPTIVLHGNAVDRIDDSYRRYLSNAFARELSIFGAPVKIILRGEDNPYV